MSKNEMISKIEQLQELEAFIEEIKEEADSIRDELKQMMLDKETEELECGQYMIRYSTVLTQRLDTTALKKAHADLYKAFTKQVTSKRFSIN